jgi:hypothetical protein
MFKSNLLVVIAASAGVLAIAQQTPTPTPIPTKKPVLPASAKATEMVSAFGFMAGRWIGVNPNGTVNEEHWMTPRGNSMVGTFRQIRRDGKPGLVELSLLKEEKGEIQLLLRHLHGGLEIPKNREELDTFKLVSVTKNKAEFAGTGKSAPVTSVIYERIDKNRMIQRVSFAPETKETGYQLVYFKE